MTDSMLSRLGKELLTTFLLGGMVTLALALLAWNYVLRGEVRTFEFEAGLLKEAVSESVQGGEAMARSLQAFYHASQQVGGDEFRVFSEAIFSNYPFIRSVSYGPRVFLRDRAAFEEEQRYWGAVGFSIFEYDERGGRKAAEERPRYFPLLHREPFGPENAVLIGYDILRQGDVKENFGRIVETAAPFPSVCLKAEDRPFRGYRLYAPVYEGKGPPDTLQARRRKVNGLLILVLDPASMFGEAGFHPHLRVRLAFLPAGTGEAETTLLRHDPKKGGEPFEELSVRHEISVSQQRLVLDVAKPLYLTGIDLLPVAMALLLGLVFSAGLLAILRGRSNLKVELAERRKAQSELARHRDRLEETIAVRTESLKKATDEARAASRAKSEFLSNMSHELRTPLNAILGFAQLMEREPQLTTEQRQNLDTIGRSGQHLLALINDVLNMARVESGKLVLEEESFALAPFLTGVEEMIRVRAEQEKLSFAVESAPDLCRFIRADRNKLRQVLVNLLGNAVKFTEEGEVCLRVKKEEGRLQFEVGDTGPGIAAEDLGRIFDPFVQTRRGRRPLEGTGLGLAISRRFARLMGGDISVESAPGKGSLFSFQIPCVEAAEGEVAEPEGRARRVTGLSPGQPEYRILVVEDREESRLLLRKLLESVGFEVAEAVNGEEAVRLFESWHPDLIWMDMRMPVMDGYQATRRIKASELGRKTVVIALTASAFEEDRKEVLAAGCDDFVRKPLEEAEIFDAMARHLGVRYIFEHKAGVVPSAETTGAEAGKILSVEDLTGLPAEVLEELKKALVELDEKKIGKVIDKIGHTHPSLAESMAELAKGFRYDELLKLMER